MPLSHRKSPSDSIGASIARMKAKEAYYRAYKLEAERRMLKKAMAGKSIPKVSDDMKEIELSKERLESIRNLEAEVGIRKRKSDDAWCVVIRIPFGDERELADETLKELLE